jgi:hypothetical protein
MEQELKIIKISFDYLDQDAKMIKKLTKFVKLGKVMMLEHTEDHVILLGKKITMENIGKAAARSGLCEAKDETVPERYRDLMK